MYDALLRRQKDRLLEPVARQYLPAVPPNAISIVALVPGLLSVWAIAGGQLWLGLALWLLNRALDGLDGVVAQVHGKKSDFGGYLDILLDYLIYLGVPIGFVLAEPTPRLFWALIFLLASYPLNILSWTLLAALLEKNQQADADRLTSFEMPSGLIEGAETVLLYTLFFLLPGGVFWLFVLMAALVYATIGQRVWWAWRVLDG